MVRRAEHSIAAARLIIACCALAGCVNDSGIKRVNAPPTVEITAPAPAEVFRQGAGLLLLTGLVGDSFDDAPALIVTVAVADAAPVAVTPDADGAVSVEVDVDLLAVGPVTLTLSATDSDDETTTDTVTVEIGGPLGVPTVEITLPSDGAVYLLGAPVAFRGHGADLSTPPDDLVFSWSSSLDGALEEAVSADGDSALFVDALSVGAHTITLSAEDGDGEIGSDSITVLIAEEDVIAEPGDLVFSEMMVNPEAVEDEVGEWVELYNTSGSSIDVGSYNFRDDDVDAWILEGPLLVGPHDYVVLCANLDLATNGGVPCDGWFFRDSTGAGLALANGEDELVLARPDGVEIDWLHYDSNWYTTGIGLGLDPSYLTGADNDDPTRWCNQVTQLEGVAELGTPGQVNDTCTAGEM
ncbi:MAG: lamin tail domain-containing protein [Pseudomonadota bacterium]|nr:lamin tail domain-containing protein [Pseudomonadota bacterium]